MLISPSLISQALGQSSAFLAQHLPRAKLHPWPSTAGAAMSLLDPGDSADGQGQDGEGLGAGAAICSASAIADTPDLEVIYEGTQAINGTPAFAPALLHRIFFVRNGV